MKAEKKDLKCSIENDFSVIIELTLEDDPSGEDKTLVKVQVLKNSAEENGFIIDFKRLEGDFFVYHECFKQFYAVYYDEEYPEFTPCNMALY
jgi:uncharacterized protein YihD (DUF1040 family)